MKKITHNRGFTLVELMITLAVGGILLSIAVPSFQSMVRNNRLATAANDFVSSMHMARSEALKLHQKVSVKAIDPSDSSNRWGKGWIVWTNPNDDSNVDPGEVVIHTRQAFSSDTLTLNSSRSKYTYTGSGLIVDDGTLTLCHDNAGRTITISATGRGSVSDTTCP